MTGSRAAFRRGTALKVLIGTARTALDQRSELVSQLLPGGIAWTTQPDFSAFNAAYPPNHYLNGAVFWRRVLPLTEADSHLPPAFT